MNRRDRAFGSWWFWHGSWPGSLGSEFHRACLWYGVETLLKMGINRVQKTVEIGTQKKSRFFLSYEFSLEEYVCKVNETWKRRSWRKGLRSYVIQGWWTSSNSQMALAELFWYYSDGDLGNHTNGNIGHIFRLCAELHLSHSAFSMTYMYAQKVPLYAAMKNHVCWMKRIPCTNSQRPSVECFTACNLSFCSKTGYFRGHSQVASLPIGFAGRSNHSCRLFERKRNFEVLLMPRSWISNFG